MTLLELWVHRPLAQSVGLALVHSLWEGVLIAVILAAALCVARSSRTRYGAACVAMLLMLASFSVTLVRLMPQPIELAKTRFPIKAPAAQLDLPTTPWKAPAPSALTALLPWMAPFWAAGVLLFHLRALGGWMAARRLRLSGVCPAPGDWQHRLDGLAARLRVAKSAALLESCLADAPVVMGYLRPVILMPVGLLAGLPSAQVEAILIHELAHIRRQDYLVNLLQTFVEGLLFYHPAVWWISGVIRSERENCCDDLAVAATGDARQYAAALAALEQNRWAAHDLALAATGGNLVKRVRRLLQQPERPCAAWTPTISAGLLVVSAGIALAGWQTPPTQKPRATVSTAAATPAAHVAPVALGLPPAPVRKAGPILLAQTLQTAPAPQAMQSVDRQLQQALQQTATAGQETKAPYKKWLNEDVAYIITDAERTAFKHLANDEEHEQFIEQFWLRRDPTPNTLENEFKEEHYRRIGYANEHFTTTSGVAGWKTDRGRIYITFGPPDEIDDHSSGGSYIRPAEQGGGTTSTFPFQQWRYRFIESVGNNVVIEFVDPNMTDEFRMAKDPSEKEALLNAAQPDAATFRNLASLAQASGASAPRPSTAVQPGRGGRGSGGATATSALMPADIFVSVGDGPKVTVSVTSEKRNTGVNVALPAGSGKLDVIAQITDVNNKAAANLRDVTSAGQLDYPAAFTLKPGSYTLKLLVRDSATGAMQTSTVSFYVK